MPQAPYVGGNRVPAPYESYESRQRPDPANEGHDAPRPRGLMASRIALLIALVVSGGVVLYGFFVDKSGLQVPISIVGLTMLGAVLLLVAFASLRGGLRVAREGSGIRSAGVSLFGGLCALGAAGSLASALILGMLYTHFPG